MKHGSIGGHLTPRGYPAWCLMSADETVSCKGTGTAGTRPADVPHAIQYPAPSQLLIWPLGATAHCGMRAQCVLCTEYRVLSSRSWTDHSDDAIAKPIDSPSFPSFSYLNSSPSSPLLPFSLRRSYSQPLASHPTIISYLLALSRHPDLLIRSLPPPPPTCSYKPIHHLQYDRTTFQGRLRRRGRYS